MVVENLVDFDMTDKAAVARRCVIDFEYLPDVRAIGLAQAGHCAARIHTDDLAAHEQAMADTLCEERRAAKEQKANSSTDAKMFSHRCFLCQVRRSDPVLKAGSTGRRWASSKNWPAAGAAAGPQPRGVFYRGWKLHMSLIGLSAMGLAVFFFAAGLAFFIGILQQPLFALPAMPEPFDAGDPPDMPAIPDMPC